MGSNGGRRGRWLGWLALALTALLAAGSADAQEPPPDKVPANEAAPEKEEPSLAEAKRLFREGNELRRAGNCQKALGLYLQSRELVPSVPNSMNAAYCLDQLERYDEALEFYEDLLVKFPSALTEADRVTIRAATAKLQTKVGKLDISANTKATLVVGGRTRGELPLPGPIRILAGKHVVRVIKDGWETFETTATVKVGETTHVDARLRALTRAGRLRVESAELQGADVFVDGAKVGQLPWEGTLAPGQHLYWVRKGGRGSAPKNATVVEGQTVLASLAVAKLGPDVRVVVEPPTADVWVDGVRVGRGAWAGALPEGPHQIEAREPGYLTGTVTLSRIDKPTVQLHLKVDSDHPRWGSRERSTLWIEAFGGGALGGSLGSGAEDSCTSNTCSDESLALGWLAGARGGYEFPFGVALELGVGFLRVTKKQTREVSDPSVGVPARYSLNDQIAIAGPFAALGASYRLPLGTRGQLTGALDVGITFASARDRVDGTATGGGATTSVGLDRSGQAVNAVAVFALPELRGDLLFDKFYVGLGIGALIFVLDGPQNDHGDIVITGVSGACTPGTVECAKNSTAVSREQAFGPTVLWQSVVRVGRRF